MTNLTRFDDVSLLITHYNRSESLSRLLSTFKKLNCTFESIVVSDDCSDEMHLEKIRELGEEYTFRLIKSDKNRGLGNNINKGFDVINTDFTLYVQEDFVPREQFIKRLREAIGLMKRDESIDIARFYSYRKYPYLKPLNNDFSEMEFGFFKPGYLKYCYYSDHPHLKRKSFTEKFGRYPENRNPEQTEYWMMMSFLKNKGKGIYYNNFKDLFEHANSSFEPSTIDRDNLRRSNLMPIRILRNMYRTAKFNFDYLVSAKKI